MKVVTEVCLILSCILIFLFGDVHAYKVSSTAACSKQFFSRSRDARDNCSFKLQTDLEQFKETTAPIRKRCIKETKTTIRAVDDTEFGEFPDDEGLKCYFKCVMENFGMMDKKTGEIKYKLLKATIPPTYKGIYNTMIDSCTETTGKDNCEKAYNFAKCTYEVNPMAFLAP
ncbi:odorant binding protein 11 [Lasioglossum baleicum]|uniref:odorant binding protein 11 n=1 Tax=Lasioglossum baleicum TaxID=434251 RepID=UPI003FCC4AF6